MDCRLQLELAMNVRAITLIAALAGTALQAADEQRLALAQRALADSNRVAQAPTPQLRETNVCIQSQAALIPVATAEEAPLLQFRKGYCTLAAATITQEANAYFQAAWAFDQSIAAWNARNLAIAKKRPAEPMPSILPLLAAISRFKAGQGDTKGIAETMNARVCNDAVATPQTCESVLQIGREWMGWTALLRDDVFTAAREFPPTSTAWTNWVAAKRTFLDRKYADSAAAYRKAIQAWEEQARAGAAAPMRDRLGPPFDLSVAYTELGGAQLLAGDAAGAIETFNLAVRKNSANSRALYLRARAHDMLGQTGAAIADYNLAARNALAKATDQASGEANLYRGISLYRRKEFTRAEDEFNNVLNFEVTPAIRADAVAWRRLSSVAAGSCEVGRKYLEEALPAVSAHFPRDEARATMNNCGATSNAQR